MTKRITKPAPTSISSAQLEGAVVILRDETTLAKYQGRKFLCTGGNGCSPTALGTKIFLRDIITGESIGYCRREDIASIEDMDDWTPAMIPACLSS